MEIVEKENQSTGAFAASANFGKGTAYLNLLQLENSRESFQRALKINKSIEGENALVLGSTLYMLGYVYEMLLDKNIALGYYQEALPIYEKYYASDAPELTTLKSIIEFLSRNE